MSCRMTLDVKDLQKHLKDDFVSKGEIVNGNTLKLTREQGGTVEVVLPEGQKITSFDLANRGGKNVLELKTSDGKTFTAHLPEAQQTEDKHVTAFEINTVGNDTSLTIRRNDGEKFVVHLPPQQQGGGGGTDLHITAFAYEPRINPGATVVSHMLVITRSDGKTFEVEIPIPNVGNPGNPGGTDIYLTDLVTGVPPVEKLEDVGDGYYFTKNIPLQGVLNNGNLVETKQPHNRLYFSAQKSDDPREAVERRPVMDITLGANGTELRIVRDDTSITTLNLPAGGGGGGGGGADKFVSGLNSTIEYGDTRTVGGVSYSKATITARLNDGTSVSTKLPFEVAFDERTGEQIFPGGNGGGGAGSGTTVVKDVAPSTSKNRTIVITDSKGVTKELTLPDNWFNGKDGKDGKDADSIKGQFITHETFDAYLNNQMLMQQWSAPLEWGLFIGNLPTYQPPNNPLYAKFKVARSLPAPVIVGEGSNERAYTRSLSLEVQKATYATWKGILLGFDSIKPLDKYDVVKSRFKDQTEERTWHASIPYKIMTVANPLRGSDNNFLYKPMLMYAFNTRGPGLYAMDVYEEWDNATEATGGVSSDQFMYYRGTIYTNTGPHGDGYFPCLISTDGVNWSEMVARIRRTTFIHIREVTDPTEKASVTADHRFKPTDYGIGRGNHDYD